MELSLLSASKEVISFFSIHPDVCIVQSDKGNKTCLMLKADYTSKMITYINKCISKGTYVVASKSAPVVAYKAFEHLRKDILKGLEIPMGTIVIPERLLILLNGIFPSKVKLPCLYGVVKSHKIEKPMRPICSTLHWTSRPIQKILLHILKECFADKLCVQNVRDFEYVPQESINNTIYSQNVSNIDYVPREITQLPVRDGYVLVKMDVNDMYGSMNKQKIASVLHYLLEHPSIKAKLPFSVGLVERMFHYSMNTSCLLTFGGTVYKQILGLPQGACDSGFLATLFLDALLQIHKEELFSLHRVFKWWKYMDDILLYMPMKYVGHFQKVFERITGLKLELEYEEECWETPLSELGAVTQISFLDLLISRTSEDNFLVSRYTKSTTSWRMINAHSTTLMSYKTNTIRAYVQKILNRTSTPFLVHDLNIFYEQAMANGYPPIFLDHLYNEVLQSEIQALKQRNTLFLSTNADMVDRYHLLRVMIQNFPVGGTEVLEEIRANYVATGRKGLVFPFRSIALSRLIQLGCSIGGMGLPVYSRVDQSGTFSKFFAQRHMQRIVDAVKKDKHTLRFGLVHCTTCGLVFVISGPHQLDHLLKTELSHAYSAISSHQTTFNHQISPVVQQLRTIKGVDASYLTIIYSAIFRSIGVSCSDPVLLSQIPLFIRGLLGYMQGYGDFQPPATGLTPELEEVFPNEEVGKSKSDASSYEIDVVGIDVVTNDVLLNPPFASPNVVEVRNSGDMLACHQSGPPSNVPSTFPLLAEDPLAGSVVELCGSDMSLPMSLLSDFFFSDDSIDSL